MQHSYSAASSYRKQWLLFYWIYIYYKEYLRCFYSYYNTDINLVGFYVCLMCFICSRSAFMPKNDYWKWLKIIEILQSKVRKCWNRAAISEFNWICFVVECLSPVRLWFKQNYAHSWHFCNVASQQTWRLNYYIDVCRILSITKPKIG